MGKNKDTNIQRVLHTAGGLHIREGKDGVQSRTITGYAILFNSVSAPLYEYSDEKAVEVVAPEAVTRDLLDGCDIKMTMFHDRQLILARSKNGKGTLTYNVDEKGVSFEFEAPNTIDGDKALELVRRGDISGCSFAFRTHYYDEKYVGRSVERVDAKTVVTYTIRTITGIYDFTLTPDPAYPDTSCETRDLVNGLRDKGEDETREKKDNEKIREQVSEMRRTAARLL